MRIKVYLVSEILSICGFLRFMNSCVSLLIAPCLDPFVDVVAMDSSDMPHKSYHIY